MFTKSTHRGTATSNYCRREVHYLSLSLMLTWSVSWVTGDIPSMSLTMFFNTMVFLFVAYSSEVLTGFQHYISVEVLQGRIQQSPFFVSVLGFLFSVRTTAILTFNWVWLTVQKFSPLSSWWETWWHLRQAWCWRASWEFYIWIIRQWGKNETH